MSGTGAAWRKEREAQRARRETNGIFMARRMRIEGRYS